MQMCSSIFFITDYQYIRPFCFVTRNSRLSLAAAYMFLNMNSFGIRAIDLYPRKSVGLITKSVSQTRLSVSITFNTTINDQVQINAAVSLNLLMNNT